MTTVASVPAVRACASGAGQGVHPATVERPSSPGLAWAWFGGTALLTAAAATQTVVWSRAMAGMGAIPMPGGWTLSMIWLPVCGQSWWDAAAAFLAMWVVMMAAMMLPVLATELWRSRAVLTPPNIASSVPHAFQLILAAAAYLGVWTVLGALIYSVGAALAAFSLQQPAFARAVPIGAGVVLMAAGAIQWSEWKTSRLVCCRRPEHRHRPARVIDGCHHGLWMGLHCIVCCTNLTAVLLILGVMNLRMMASVTVAIALERLLPAGRQAARATGLALIMTGLSLMVTA